MKIKATELSNKSGEYLMASMREPVIVERNGKPVSVLVSYHDYQELQNAKEMLEDKYWGERANQAMKDGEFLTHEESMDFLKSL